MNVELLELASAVLDELCEEVVFVGGATVALWITDPSAPETRVTDDVDVIVEVATRRDFYVFEEKLREKGFVEDTENGVICRWKHRETSLILDAMPADPTILGFSNRWYTASLARAVDRTLPSGASIRAVPPSYFLATKIEAFKDRGKGDFLGSPDFGDIIVLIDGRAEVETEVAAADSDLRKYLSEEFETMLANPRFDDGVSGALRGDVASQQRGDLIVKPRIRSIIDAG
jgi:hypothetical protein